MGPGSSLTAAEKAGLPDAQHQHPAPGSCTGAQQCRGAGLTDPRRLVTPPTMGGTTRRGKPRAEVPAPGSENAPGSSPYPSAQMEAAP